MHFEVPSESEGETMTKKTDWAAANTVLHGAFPRALAERTNPVPDSAVAVVQAEGNLCDIKGGFIADKGVNNELFSSKTNWFTVLINMYWRSLRQVAVWNVFLYLLKNKLVDLDSLQLPIEIMECSRASYWFARFLRCFDVIATQADEAWSGKIPGQGVEWLTDIDCGSSFASVGQAIQASGILGDVHKEKYDRFQEDFSYEPDIEKDPHDRLGKLNPDGSMPPGHNVFAFWLPHGLTENHDARIERLSRSTKRAQSIEDAFRQVESPPIGVLIIDFQSLIGPTSTIHDEAHIEDVSDVLDLDSSTVLENQELEYIAG